MYRILIAVCLMASLVACDDTTDNRTADQKEHDRQEQLLQEAVNQVGMPAMKNFREKKLLKDILEMRDQSGLVTYTYVKCEMTGKYTFLGQSIGFGIPYATEFTNPQKIAYTGTQVGVATLPQADPNGLFSPSSAEGTWVLMKDPHGTDVKPVYIEDRILVSPFPLRPEIVNKD